MSDTTPADTSPDATNPAATGHDVFITRSFNAPRDVVWKFWTQPEYLAQWFGPAGFSVPIDSVAIDLVVGGRWNLTMVDDATGESYPLRTTILELVEPELLVGTMESETAGGPLDSITLRVQFHDHGDRTRITLHQGPFTEENRAAAGWEMSFVKLDQIFAAGLS